jgi:hypothetical protein
MVVDGEESCDIQSQFQVWCIVQGIQNSTVVVFTKGVTWFGIGVRGTKEHWPFKENTCRDEEESHTEKAALEVAPQIEA